jgi:hypothetical protein
MLQVTDDGMVDFFVRDAARWSIQRGCTSYRLPEPEIVEVSGCAVVDLVAN